MKSHNLDYYLKKTYLPSYSWFSKDQMLQKIKETNYDNIHYLKYNVDHDGYDQYGPESDLHDIYIWYFKDNKFYIDSYHTEEWYQPNSKPIFELWSTYEITSEEEWCNLIEFNNFEFTRKLVQFKKI